MAVLEVASRLKSIFNDVLTTSSRHPWQSPPARTCSADLGLSTYRGLLALVAVLTAAILILNVEIQIYDSNLLLLSEATALLAGDHPYRDFFEWGAPLAAYLSAGAQLLVGYRLIGEFLLQWLFIVAGVVISFDLGLRLSRSIAASLVMMALALVILAHAPTYHYSKLFFFPLTIWLGWRYMDHPGVRRSAVLGFTAAVAFLFRHDYGLYIVCASVVALVLSRVAVPASRRLRSIVNDSAAYAVAVAVVVTPWAIVVQMNEGLVEYVQLRAAMYEGSGRTYASLLKLNPVRELTPEPPAPRPAIVGFLWRASVDEELQHQLERQHGLRSLHERDARGRWRYEVSNVYDIGLFGLDPYINDGIGFEWDRLLEMRWHLPSRDNATLWLQQMALLVPLLLLISAGLEMWRSRYRADPVPLDACRMVLAGTFLAVVDSALFRQWSYVVVVAPVTAALSARFLVGKTALRRGCAIGVLLLTVFAALVAARRTPLFRPSELVSSVSRAFGKLLASPPVDGHPSYRYLHDCTAPGDRLLVTGMTPFEVSYYAHRPIAGGHLYWPNGWRSDPVHEAQSLALLQSQSVPIAFSTGNRVLEDFRRYPKIREYLVKHYVEAEGSNGLILVDTRRQPTGWFGPMGFPCFR